MISDKADNRNIISLEDLKEETDTAGEEKVTKDVTKKSEEEKKSPYLSDEEIKEYLERYRGRIPSVILRDIYEMLKGRRITERHIDRIVEKVEAMLNADNQLRKIDDIYKKLESLEKLLRSDVSKVVNVEAVKTETPEQMSDEKSEMAEESVGVAGEGGVESAERESVGREVEVGESARGVRAEIERPEEKFAGVEEPQKIPGGEVMQGDVMHSGLGRAQTHAHPVREAQDVYREHRYHEHNYRYPARRDRWVESAYAYYHEACIEEPRLSRIPTDAKGIMLLLKWIEFLMERVGYDGLEDVLNYYVDINWISEDVLMTVLRYARGIKLYHDNSDWRPVGYMNVQDHLMSLLYIEALRTGRFDRNLIMEVEKDLYRMKKEVAELHGV